MTRFGYELCFGSMILHRGELEAPTVYDAIDVLQDRYSIRGEDFTLSYLNGFQQSVDMIQVDWDARFAMLWDQDELDAAVEPGIEPDPEAPTYTYCEHGKLIADGCDDCGRPY